MNKFYDHESGRTLKERPEAYILDKVFDPEYFSELKKSLALIKENNVLPYTLELGRSGINTLDKSFGANVLNEAFDKVVATARSIFGQDVKPTYALWVAYRGFRASLPRHIDDNACTYTIDLCMSYETQWPICIEGKELLLEPNQAAVYYGEDQYHWRGEFPSPLKNEVQMIFFHFAEPDHWFFTKGPEHKQEIVRIKEEHMRKNGIII